MEIATIVQCIKIFLRHLSENIVKNLYEVNYFKIFMLEIDESNESVDDEAIHIGQFCYTIFLLGSRKLN